ncbi:MAG: 3-dehydroquinate dehydratase [Clostridia bacterium]|nr:3-dehydroquinate dehydratase [Clostridia bacterium]MBQ4158541.1 3-dehydroquinate dehydratase [Clostridia bacterium]
MNILIINGPNLNMLGIREPDIYGKNTYQDLVDMIRSHAEKRGVSCGFFQSNHEGAIVDAIQDAMGKYDGIIINPAAYTHTSVAILDAVKSVGIKTVEVHISDPDQREDFRKISYVRLAAIATVKGKGFSGYLEAMDILIDGNGEDKS